MLKSKFIDLIVPRIVLRGTIESYGGMCHAKVQWALHRGCSRPIKVYHLRCVLPPPLSIQNFVLHWRILCTTNEHQVQYVKSRFSYTVTLWGFFLKNCSGAGRSLLDLLPDFASSPKPAYLNLGLSRQHTSGFLFLQILLSELIFFILLFGFYSFHVLSCRHFSSISRPPVAVWWAFGLCQVSQRLQILESRSRCGPTICFSVAARFSVSAYWRDGHQAPLCIIARTTAYGDSGIVLERDWALYHRVQVLPGWVEKGERSSIAQTKQRSAGYGSVSFFGNGVSIVAYLSRKQYVPV